METSCFLRFQIIPLPPFRLDLTVWGLRRGLHNRLDRWDGETYRRTIAWDGALFEVSVKQHSGIDNPVLEIETRAKEDCPGLGMSVIKALNCLLGLNIDLTCFYHFAEDHEELENLVANFRGVKPPRFLNLFEALVNGIIFQHLSLSAGTNLLNHLVETWGLSVPGAAGNAFPLPETIAALNAEDFRTIGISLQKGKALTELAARVMNGLNLERAAGMSDDEALVFLCRLRGIGKWTAQYSLLRGLGRLNVFAGDDQGVRNKIKNWLGGKQASAYEKIPDVNALWHPYGGVVYFHLLLNHLAKKGYIS